VLASPPTRVVQLILRQLLFFENNTSIILILKHIFDCDTKKLKTFPHLFQALFKKIIKIKNLLNCISNLKFHNLLHSDILQRAWSANFKMVRYVVLRPLRPELLAAKSTAVTIKWSRREVTSVAGL
jgi:hypothetical protein